MRLKGIALSILIVPLLLQAQSAPAPVTLADLDALEPSQRFSALLRFELEQRGTPASLPILTRCLLDRDAVVLLKCLELVSARGTDANSLAPSVAVHLTHHDTNVAQTALNALMSIEPRSQEFAALWQKYTYPSTGAFFSGPGVNAVSISAAIVAVLSFGLSLWFNRGQNKKWAMLNSVRLIVHASSMIAFRKMSKAEFAATNWGYNPLQAALVDDDLETDQVKVFSKLVYLDPAQNYIPTPPFLTVSEANSFLQEKITNYVLNKQIQFYFTLKNAGSIGARNVRITVIGQGSGESKKSFTFAHEDPVDEMGPSEEANIRGQIEQPVVDPWPGNVNFTFKISYDVNGKTQTHVHKRTLALSNMYWSHGHA